MQIDEHRPERGVIDEGPGEIEVATAQEPGVETPMEREPVKN